MAPIPENQDPRKHVEDKALESILKGKFDEVDYPKVRKAALDLSKELPNRGSIQSGFLVYLDSLRDKACNVMIPDVGDDSGKVLLFRGEIQTLRTALNGKLQDEKDDEILDIMGNQKNTLKVQV